jgi:hypothetical protein
VTSLLVIALLCAVLAVQAWGPGNHLEFAERVLRRRRTRLPHTTARLLEEQRAAFLYGNIAADIINFKAVGGHYNHCHRWTIVEEMRRLAVKPREEAFILGYLCHLAADTIAHNHFVPYHLARYARGRQLGHLYWELNADRFVPAKHWQVVTDLKATEALDELDDLINRTVPKKALSMGTNKALFNHVLLVSERQNWRSMMATVHPMGHVRLTRGFLRLFQDAAVERALLALQPRGLAALAHIDTNGKAAQKQALAVRRQLLMRMRPSVRRRAEAEELAAPFLEGMQSPPPRAAGAGPHW